MTSRLTHIPSNDIIKDTKLRKREVFYNGITAGLERVRIWRRY